MIKKIIAEFEYKQTQRKNWEGQWADVARYFLPHHSQDFSMTNEDEEPGEKRGEDIYSSVPIIALSRFVGIVDGLLTPLDKKWHTLKPKNPDLNNNQQVAKWFDKLNKTLFDYRYNPSSNFAAQNSMRWEQMGAFGTGVLFIDYDHKDKLRYKCLDIKNITLGENHQGVINRVDRFFHLTVPEIKEQFGDKVELSEEMRKVLGTKEENKKKFPILHTVLPASHADKMNKDGTTNRVKYTSYYIDFKNKSELMKEHYFSFPFSISRYSVSPEEMFGRSPAMQVMADVIRLNSKESRKMKAVDRLLDPVILAQGDYLTSGGLEIDMRPNAVIMGGLDQNGNPTVRPFSDGSQVDVALEDIDRLEKSINDAFLITLFQIMVDTPRMTATEALIRVQEKSMLLTPIVAKQQSEALSPLIERELSILRENHLIDDPPFELGEGDDWIYDIMYESPLNKMQESEALVGLNKVITTLSPLAQIDPNFFDRIDNGRALELAMDAAGLPAEMLKDQDVYDEEVADRKAKENAMFEQQQAESLGKVVSDLAGAGGAGQ